jgi:hypothetical protein
MRKILLLTTVFFVTQSFAPAKAPIPNVGDLVKQFTSAIKPSSFLNSWTKGKSGFLSNAAKITSASGLAKSVSSLAGFIKPTMFKDGFNLKGLQQGASTAKTMTDATGLLKNLEEGLKPEAMTDDWASKKTGWLSALSLLK